MEKHFEMVKVAAIGSAGIASSEVIPTLLAANPSDLTQIVQLATQIIIGIATLFGLFKKKSKKS